jgi:predicted amidohydrolase
MFLQDTTLSKKSLNKYFYETLNLANKNKLDLLVFPEHAYCPEDEKLDNLAFLSYGDECDYEAIANIYYNYAEIAGCPIIFSRSDKYEFIYAIYVSPIDGEVKWYGKHIATFNSSFDLSDYEENMDYIFSPIEYKGYKIGMTVCYDVTKPLFSRSYKDIDILINLTGGHVDYKKWSIYQKARALENKCNHLCVMAYFDKSKKNKSYVFGFDGFGKKLDFTIINNKDYASNDLKNGLYVFDIKKGQKDFIKFNPNKAEVDEFLITTPSINKNVTIRISIDEIIKSLNSKNKIDEDLYVIKLKNENLIILNVSEYKIEDPINVEKLIYNEKLKNYNNKRYLIFNKWENLDSDYYSKRLSTILKARASENFCVVMLASPQINECIQVGLNKNIQILQIENGKYGLDLQRASGPESFWKNNYSIGIKSSWREKYKLLIDRISQ